MSDYNYSNLSGSQVPNSSHFDVNLLTNSIARLQIKYGAKNDTLEMYSKAIEAHPSNKSLHLGRIELAVELFGNDNHPVVLCYKECLAKCLTESDFKATMQKELPTYQRAKKDFEQAFEALHAVSRRLPAIRATSKLIDRVLKLYLLTGQFEDCSMLIFKFYRFTLEYVIGSPFGPPAVSYRVPSNVAIGIKVMFILCLVKLKLFGSARPLIDETLVKENVEEHGAVYLEVAKELLAADLPHQAMKLFSLLSQSQRHNVPDDLQLKCEQYSSKLRMGG